MFGCGYEYCVSCYPFQYRCEDCATEFATPLAVGDSFVCPECEWVNDRKENKERV